MEGNPNVRSTPQLVLALLVIILGILFTLDNLDILAAHDYLRFWPLALMALGTAKFFDSGRPSSQAAGVVFFGIGSLFLLRNLNVIRFHPAALWPLVLVIIGAVMLWRVVTRDRIGETDSESSVSAIAVLSGVERSFNSQDFRGGELTAIMGGCEVDLRQASIQAEQAVVDVFAFWGGIEIRVPEDWVVVMRGFPLLGGFSDSTRFRSYQDPAPVSSAGPKRRLVIKGFVIMGGVEVKN